MAVEERKQTRRSLNTTPKLHNLAYQNAIFWIACYIIFSEYVLSAPGLCNGFKRTMKQREAGNLINVRIK
jgi:hypothetical protein